MDNLFDPLPTQLPEELIDVLITAPGVRIERIVSTGHASPPGFWYDQPQDEWVVVLRGQAQIQFQDESAPRPMHPGDHLLIPAHRKHRVVWTTSDAPTVWLAIFFSGT